MKTNEAYAKIREVLDELRETESRVLSKAESIADEHGVSFSYGDYGSGKTYYPKGTPEHDIPWDCEDEASIENGYSTCGIWVSSSEMC
jgi:hypothetical protein